MIIYKQPSDYGHKKLTEANSVHQSKEARDGSLTHLPKLDKDTTVANSATVVNQEQLNVDYITTFSVARIINILARII